MAFAILEAAIGASIAGDTWDGVPANNLQVADQTASTAVQAFVAPVRTVRAFVWQKGYSGGTTSNFVTQYQLQVADNLAFTSNVRTIATYGAPLTVNAFYINGVVPDNLSAQWCKVLVTLSAGSAVTYDVSLSGC